MHKQRKMMLIASGIGALGMFLPWVEILFVSINGLRGWGILVFLCFLGCAAIAFMGNQSRPLDKTMWTIALVLSGIAALVMIIFVLRSMDTLGMFTYGFYLALIGSLFLLYATYVYRESGFTIKDGIESLKESVNKRSDPQP